MSVVYFHTPATVHSRGALSPRNNRKQNNKIKQHITMIVVPIKEGENIERALKRFKRKFERTGVVKELRRRQQFDKPSVRKRLAMEHAIYVQQLHRNED